MSRVCKDCTLEIGEREHYVDTYSSTGEMEYSRCWACDRKAVIKTYVDTNTITTTLLTDASMCQYYLYECPERLATMRPEVAKYYTQNALTLLGLNHAYKEVTVKFKEFEAKYWLPKLRLQYNWSNCRGHSAETEDLKAMMWGCAGRVMITLQDSKAYDVGKFGGAWITFIFDDSSKTATGGIQGMCATKTEAIGLIEAAIDGLPEMKPDEEVHLAGF